jgi:hypothetical protein
MDIKHIRALCGQNVELLIVKVHGMYKRQLLEFKTLKMLLEFHASIGTAIREELIQMHVEE